MVEQGRDYGEVKVLISVIGVIIVVFLILLLIGFIFDVSIAGTTVRQRVRNIYTRTIAPAVDYLKVNIAFFSWISKGVDIAFGGEIAPFALEGEYEERVKTGVEIGELTPLFGDVGVLANIIAYKIDEETEYIPASASCSLYSGSDEIIKKDIGDGKLEIPVPPEDSNENEIGVDCIFPSEEIGAVSASGLGKVKFDLTYSLSPQFDLDIFVIRGNTYEDYKRDFDLAFQELDEGIYGDNQQKIPSSTKYIPKIEAIMNFNSQPLGIGKEHWLRFEFYKKEKENKVNFKGFDLFFPKGIEFKDCQFFGSRTGKMSLKREYLAEINKKLNDKEKTGAFICEVNVLESVLGEAGGQIVQPPKVVGILNYDYTLTREQKIEIS